MKNYAAAMPFRNRVSDILNLCAKLKYTGKNVKGTAGGRALLLSGILLCSGLAEAQTPTITSVSPNAGSTGTAVTITGTNFNTTAANNIVYFGATKATVSSA